MTEPRTEEDRIRQTEGARRTRFINLYDRKGPRFLFLSKLFAHVS